MISAHFMTQAMSSVDVLSTFGSKGNTCTHYDNELYPAVARQKSAWEVKGDISKSPNAIPFSPHAGYVN